jgi:hypothetical protein
MYLIRYLRSHLAPSRRLSLLVFRNQSVFSHCDGTTDITAAIKVIEMEDCLVLPANESG